MMETDLIPAMSVFTVTMDLHGRKLEQTLMGKRKVTRVVGKFLYLLTDQQWLLDQLIMMETELTPVMSVFTVTMDLHGCKLDQTLMGKLQVIAVAFRFRYLLTAQG